MCWEPIWTALGQTRRVMVMEVVGTCHMVLVSPANQYPKHQDEHKLSHSKSSALWENARWRCEESEDTLHKVQAPL